MNIGHLSVATSGFLRPGGRDWAYWSGTLVVALAATMGMGYGALAEDTETLKIELPEPSFEGTPLDYFGKNLEKRSFKPRADPIVPKGTTLISRDKSVAAGAKPAYGKLEFITNGDKKYQAMQNAPTLPETLSAALLRQIALLTLSEREREIIEYLIWSFDGRGYLIETLEEIALRLTDDMEAPPVEEFESAENILQKYGQRSCWHRGRTC